MNHDINLLFIILGAWLISSVLNVFIHRLPIMLDLKPSPSINFKIYNLFLPRSHCPKCEKTIAWYYNIPILSYILLKGKCAYCQQKISPRYPIIELAYTICVGLLYLTYGLSLPFFASVWFTALLLIQAAIDLELMLIPDVLNYVLLWSGLFANSFSIFCNLNEAIYGAIFAYLGLWIFYHLFHKVTGKKGFGYGDFKLYAAIGAWLGIQKIFACIMLSCFVGIIFGLFAAWKSKKGVIQTIIPFGPALALAGFLLILFPNTVFIPGLGF